MGLGPVVISFQGSKEATDRLSGAQIPQPEDLGSLL